MNLTHLSTPLALVQNEPGARALAAFLVLTIAAFALQRRRAHRCYSCD